MNGLSVLLSCPRPDGTSIAALVSDGGFVFACYAAHDRPLGWCECQYGSARPHRCEHVQALLDDWPGPPRQW